MTKKKIILFSVIGALVALFLIPTAAGAATQSEALAGLKEYYSLLVDLAQKGLETYIQYLKAL